MCEFTGCSFFWLVFFRKKMNSPLESEPKKKVGVVFEIKEKVAIQAVTDHFLIIYILTRTTVII
jgi:hypothetical protein